MSNKYALIIANTEYTDSGLAQLTAPGKDADDFARVLREKDFCAFDEVNVLLNQPSSNINEAIDEFFDQKKQDDLLVLYFSGHGVRDELGALYLAVKNTNRFRLRSTAIKSDFIKEAMDQSRSRRQVLILDCCNSGAFSQGTKAATGVSIGTATAFEGGFGRVILTASDSTQFAWEGDKVIGNTDNSLFTHYLVEGLEGKADRDGDGQITVDELYDYAYEKVRLATPKQTPSKFSTKQQGEIVLRQNIRLEDIKSIPLPDDLLAATKSSLPYVREAAVKQLDELLKSKNLGLIRATKELLEYIAENDDSRTISRAAAEILASNHQEKLIEMQRNVEIGKNIIQDTSLKSQQQFDFIQQGEKRADAMLGSSSPLVPKQPIIELKKIEEQSKPKVNEDIIKKISAQKITPKNNVISEPAKIAQSVSSERKFPALAFILHLLLGIGIFFTNKKTKLKWIYPLSVTAIITGFTLAVFDIDYKNWGGDVIPDETAAIIGILGLCVYIFGFYDILRTDINKPGYLKAVGYHVLFGFGLFFVNKRLNRKWIYPLIFFYAILDIILGPMLRIDPFEGDFGAFTFFSAVIIYLLSFIDVINSYNKEN